MEQIYTYLGDLLSANQFFQGGLVLGLITWFGYQLKAIPTFVWMKAKYYATYTVHFDESSEFYRVFTEWLNEHHPSKLRNIEVKFYGERGNRGEGRPAASSSERTRKGFTLSKAQHSDSNIIRHKGRWLWIMKDRARLDGARDVMQMFYNSYTITGFFAKAAIEDLCRTIEARKNAEIADDVLKVYFNANGYFESQHVSVVKTLDHIFFAGKDRLLDDLREFIGKKALYARKGIKYKRAYLFYGPGGTGKTSLGLAIAKHLDYDLYVINLAGIKSDLDLQNQAPRIERRAVILLEDIDCVLADREVKGKKLNFSTVLNFLDGLYAPSDCIFVLTTNKPEKLDPALTRKGRIDLALHVDYPHVPEVEDYMSDFYDVPVRLGLHAGLKAFYGMSAVQDVCLQNSLQDAKRLVGSVFIRPSAVTTTVEQVTKRMLNL